MEASVVTVCAWVLSPCPSAQSNSAVGSDIVDLCLVSISPEAARSDHTKQQLTVLLPAQLTL